jgi:hypothetical protein
VADACEHGSEHFTSLKYGESYDCLDEYQLLKNYPGSRGCLCIEAVQDCLLSATCLRINTKVVTV